MAFARGRKRIAGLALAGCALLAAAPAFAQGAPCTRADLQRLTEIYLKAQTIGDPTPIPMGGWANYNEQLEMGTMSTGILSKPQKIDFSRSIYDTQGCASFTEIAITDPAHPYVLGTKLMVRGDTVNEFQVLVTDKDDWLFNAENTLKYSKAEKWDPIPEADRDTRETLMAAANAYLDSFNDKKIVTPWGSPCARLEGGLYTAKGAPGEVRADDTCNVGVPSDVKFVDRTYVVDPELGAVMVMSLMGKNTLPDAHTFRVEKGKIRYVHTITVCKSPNCGFPLPAALQPKAN
jgi:hypothetical protein